MDALIDPKIFKEAVEAEMSSFLNQAFFGTQKIEVPFDSDWSMVTGGDKQYQRITLSDISYENGACRATHTYTREVPNETAKAELQAVMDKWQSRGWTQFVDALTNRPVSDEYESWTDDIFDELTDTETVKESVEITNPTFFKFEFGPLKVNPVGLQIPYSNARITNLTIEGIEPLDL